MRRLSGLHFAHLVVALSAILATPDAPAVAAATDPDEVERIAGLDVAVWLPADGAGTHPLILFSHGWSGCKTQSGDLMRAFADHGMLVMAPDHQDNGCATGLRLPVPLPPELAHPGSWSAANHANRRDDMTQLLAAAQVDARYSPLIDPSRVALVGHSLGGYTVLGLAGAWPDWQIGEIAAVVALAPYAETFLTRGDLAKVKTPMLFEAGDADMAVKLTMVQGLFAQAAAPCCIVVYPGAGHLAWVDPAALPPDLADWAQPQFHDAISAAAVGFLNDVFDGLPIGTSLTQPDCK